MSAEDVRIMREALDVLIAHAGHSPDPLRHSDKAEADARAVIDRLEARIEALTAALQELAGMASPGIISERARRILARTEESS